MNNPLPAPHAYQRLAQQMREHIQTGQLAVGSRMPSVRNLCASHKVSKSTVLGAYTRLEAEGLIEARPRSGYFVCATKPPQTSTLKTPAISQPSALPAPVSADQVLQDIMQQGAAFDLLRPSNQEPTTQENPELRRSLARAQRRQTHREQQYYDNPQGLRSLREQLALRIAQGGSQLDASDLLITAGCQHSLLLALMATTATGDLVALESPGFYGALQLIEALGLKALELASDANTGISPDALALALEHWDIKALIISPSFATPTGALMPDAHKRRILELTVPRNIAVIEDDIYGELSFAQYRSQHSTRPRTLHSFERELFSSSPQDASVLLCSSFSKSLSRDLRLGWIAPGRYQSQVQRLKLVTSLATSQTQQQGLSDFLSSGGLDRHLRAYRLRLQQQCQQLQQLIHQHLPMALSASQPQGGLCLWLELPKTIDTIKLYAIMREKKIIVTPGPLFSGQSKYINFLRLSFSHPWTEPRIEAVKSLGAAINGLLEVSE